MRKRCGNLFLILVFLFLISFGFAAQLKVTEEHPFYLDGDWVVAKDLGVGEEFVTIDGKVAKITSIQLVEPKKPFFVYNFEVPFFNNFVVGLDGLIVHNSNPQGNFRGDSQGAPIYSYNADETIGPIIGAGKGREKATKLEEIVSQEVHIGENVNVKRGISDPEAQKLRGEVVKNHPDWDFDRVRAELQKYDADFSRQALNSRDLEGFVEGSGYAHAYVGHGPPSVEIPGEKLYFNTEADFQRTLAQNIDEPDISFTSTRTGKKLDNYKIDESEEFGTQFVTTILDGDSGELVTHYRQPVSEVIGEMWDGAKNGYIPNAKIYTSSGASKSSGIVYMRIPQEGGGELILKAVKTEPGVPAQVSLVRDIDPSDAVSQVEKLTSSPSKMLSSSKSDGMELDPNWKDYFK